MEQKSWCVLGVWIAAAISKCVVVVHFHDTESVKAYRVTPRGPARRYNGHVPPNTQ
jgi:hypothetical protein